MSLASSIKLAFNCRFTTARDLSTTVDPLNIDRSITWTDGDAADKADMIFHDTRSLADGANEELDLYASGSLTDPHGGALTIEKLKLVYLYNTSSDATLLVGAATANQVNLFSDGSDILEIPPGGKFLWTAPGAAGLDVTTDKFLKLEHDGTGSSALEYEIILIGCD